MQIKEEDFPAYQLLVKLGQPGVENAINDFKAALAGGDEEKFGFALGLQTLTGNPAIARQIPGMTPEICAVTNAACLAVFNDVASRGHEGGKFMVEDFKARGLGRSPRP